jgi:hypothetical protein
VNDAIIASRLAVEDGRPVCYAFIWPPRTCPTCKRSVAAVVNRDGKTLCLSCDTKKQEARDAANRVHAEEV